MTPLMTTAEVAQIIREDPNTVRSRCAAGQIEATRIGEKWRISQQALGQFLANRIQSSTRVPNSVTRRRSAHRFRGTAPRRVDAPFSPRSFESPLKPEVLKPATQKTAPTYRHPAQIQRPGKTATPFTGLVFPTLSTGYMASLMYLIMCSG